MALMGSVYSTIVMSLERYFRLCCLQVMSKRMFNACVALCIIFPTIFYSPKFLEYRYITKEQEKMTNINCTDFLNEQRYLASIATLLVCMLYISFASYNATIDLFWKRMYYDLRFFSIIWHRCRIVCTHVDNLFWKGMYYDIRFFSIIWHWCRTVCTHMLHTYLENCIPQQ